MIELFDDEDICPECATRRSEMPSLTLKYTTCCGKALCNDCIVSKFRQKKSILCSSCNSSLKRTDLVDDNLDTQNFNTIQATNITIKIFPIRNTNNMSTKDAKLYDQEYNKYLELKSDIIYDMVYGNKESREKAIIKRKELNQYVEDYITKHHNELSQEYIMNITKLKKEEEAYEKKNKRRI